MAVRDTQTPAEVLIAGTPAARLSLKVIEVLVPTPPPISDTQVAVECLVPVAPPVGLTLSNIEVLHLPEPTARSSASIVEVLRLPPIAFLTQSSVDVMGFPDNTVRSTLGALEVMLFTSNRFLMTAVRVECLISSSLFPPNPPNPQSMNRPRSTSLDLGNPRMVAKQKHSALAGGEVLQSQITSATLIDPHLVRVTFNQSCIDTVNGPWSFQVFKLGTWWNASLALKISDTQCSIAFIPALVAGDPWRLLSDNGDIAWLSPLVSAAIPQSGLVS